MSQALSRSLAPRSIALIGPVVEISATIEALRALGYAWQIWPVAEGGAAVAGIASVCSIAELPGAPDLAHVALRGEPLQAALSALAERGAGGAVCPYLDADALAAMDAPLPVFAGGLLSPVARLPFWPGGAAVAPARRGPALLLTDPERLGRLLDLRRGVPLSYAVPLGRDATAATGLLPLSAELLSDERVTALAVQADTLAAPADILDLGRVAQKHGKPVVFLSGQLGAGSAALLRRAGISYVTRSAALIEALWILHLVGPLPANALAAIVSGPGLAERAETLATAQGLRLAPLGKLQQEALARELPSARSPDNPLDVSGLAEASAGWLARIFAEMMIGEAVLTLAVIRNAGEAGWARAAEAAARARERVGMPLALLAPNRAEMTDARSLALLEAGVIPLAGLKPALEALRAAMDIGALVPGGGPLLMPRPGQGDMALTRGAAAAALLGLAVGGEGSQAPLQLRLSADPAFGYLVELSSAAGGLGSGLLPLSPRACREMAMHLGLGPEQADALAAVLRAVQDHVAAARGAVAGLEIALDLGDNGAACARSIELRAWTDAAQTRRRSPE